MAQFEAETDISEWDRAMVLLGQRMLANTHKAGRESMYLVERNVKFYLRTFTHRESEPTNSPRGGPPALVTGNLVRSWRSTRPHAGRTPHTVETEGGPTTVYSRIQELSGMAGRGHLTFIPKRPYVRPMVLVSRRGVRRIHMNAWRAAIRGV